MHRCASNPDRCLVIMSSGNLATTQGVIQQVRRDAQEGAPRNINTLNYLADVAEYLGDVLVQRIRKHTEQTGFVPDATLILGGQIKGRSPNIYMIYPQGNYISSSDDTPYLQIGESKYGKPVLDRFLTRETSLEDAAVCALISMDSTMKSNASVGPPIEVMVYPRDQFNAPQHYKFEAGDPYLLEISHEWANHLNRAFRSMPRLGDHHHPHGALHPV
jgi:putative proteasome-type protease